MDGVGAAVQRRVATSVIAAAAAAAASAVEIATALVVGSLVIVERSRALAAHGASEKPSYVHTYMC